MPDIDNDTLERRLAGVFSGITGRSSDDERAIDFSFHMTDWKQDLLDLADAMNRSEGISDERFEEVIRGFLIHASGHINAAAALAGIEPVKFETP